jgi:hypothetical protein
LEDVAAADLAIDASIPGVIDTISRRPSNRG